MNSELFTFFPPEFRFTSFISLSLNVNKFIEFTQNMQPDKIRSSNVEQDDRIFAFFVLALIYENEELTRFVFKILQSLHHTISYDEFQKFETKINKYISTGQQGGGKLKDIVNHLTLIGLFIFTAFYDYYIITNGTWQQMSSTITELKDISSKITSGCGEYKPSKVAHFLAEYGSRDTSVVYSIDSTIQCLTTPSILSAKLEEVISQNNDRIILNEFQENMQNLPGLEMLRISPPVDAEPMGSELVIFGQKGSNIVPYLEQKLLMNDQVDIKRLELLAKLPLAEFKKVIEEENKPKSEPTYAPTFAVPTSSPIFHRTTTFLSDLTGAVSEIVPTQLSASLNIENMLLYALQDSIRDIIRRKEDTSRDTQRYVEDLIRKASRLVDQIYAIPKLLFFLFTINSSAFYIFIYFAKKIYGKRIRSSSLTIEDINDTLMIEGGYKKMTKRRKTRKLKKQKTKNRKTNYRKIKRMTRKYRK